MERDTGRSKGFGFVEMGSDAETQAAINGMNGQPLGGRSITVNDARPIEARLPRTGGFGGGGGYGVVIVLVVTGAMAVETVRVAVITAAVVVVVAAATKPCTPGQWQGRRLTPAALAWR